MFSCLKLGAVVVAAAFCISTAPGQEVDPEVLSKERAIQEIELILDRSDRILDLKQRVRVRGLAASIVWNIDQARSRSIFKSLWASIDKMTDDGSLAEEDARIDLLQFILPIDRDLARELEMSASSADGDRKESGRDEVLDRLTGVDLETRRKAFLAWRVVEDDPELAASILDLGRATSIPPLVPTILSKIREKNPILANGLVMQALENFETQTPTVALAGLGTLMTYVFPAMPSGHVTIDVINSDEQVRGRFTAVAYSSLKRSSLQPDDYLVRAEGMSSRSLEFRRLGQALISTTLTALTPHYMAEAFPEVASASLTFRSRTDQAMIGVIDAQVAVVKGLVSRIAASKSIEVEIVDKLVKKDYHGAILSAEKISIPSHRTAWEDVVYVARTKEDMRHGQLLRALESLRKVSNQEQALDLFIQLSGKASEAKDENVSTLALQEAFRIATDSEGGARIRSLLAIASDVATFNEPFAANVLRSAVDELNALSNINETAGKTSAGRGSKYWDDPDNYLSSRLFHRAFRINGRGDMEETLNIALTLRLETLKMAGTLAAIEERIQRLKNDQPRKRSKSKPESKN